MPRIKPITSKSELPVEHQAAAEEVVKVFGQIRGPFSILLHSPKLAQQLIPLVPFIHHECIVEGRLRSIGILAASREYSAAYVWAAQVAAARRNGVSDELIGSLRAKAEPGKFPPQEREIVSYARQLARANRVDQAVFDALKNRYGVQWLVELTAVLGYFAMVSGVANAFEVEAPPDGDRLPAQP